MGAVGARRRLAQGHLGTQLGGAGLCCQKTPAPSSGATAAAQEALSSRHLNVGFKLGLTTPFIPEHPHLMNERR